MKRALLDDKWLDRTRLRSPRQVTDIYLLALAAAHQGRFVTFDRSIPVQAVARAGKDCLVVL
jgi:uncharacterized protein